MTHGEEVGPEIQYCPERLINSTADVSKQGQDLASFQSRH